MKFVLKRCGSCGRYTLAPLCPSCGAESASAHPAKFSPDDRYAKYRLADRYR